MKLEDYFKNSKVIVWKENFAVVKSKKSYPEAFANIIDKNETTVVIEENKVNKNDIIEIERNWKILTFDMVLPFELVGFIAKISEILAKENISIFVISAYSTDHILIKKKDLEKTKEKLKSIGCVVENI
ncbi:MAG: ACT domain-containing protein [archaeon]